VLIVYVVDAEGKRDATFVPVMAATLKGPDAVLALLRPYLQRLELTKAAQVRFIADGAPWALETGAAPGASIRASGTAGA
jgi:hypothetical protein